MKRMSVMLIVALLWSCATTTQVNLRKPAELNFKPVKKIAVLKFDFDGEIDLGVEKISPNKLKAMGLSILKDLIQTKTRKLKPKTTVQGAQISDLLVSKLVNNGFYTVVERERLEEILKEQELALSGLVDESTAVEVGKLAGVEGILFGSGSFTVRDKGAWETYKVKKKKKNGKTVEIEKKRYRISRWVQVQITYRLVDVETGKILVAQTNTRANFSATAKRGPRKYSATGATERAARNALPHWNPIVNNLVDRLLNKTVYQIAPHYVTERRKIEGGKSKKMKQALEYSKRGLWEEAKALWEEVARNENSKDYLNAIYNLGLYHEMMDNLQEARDYYNRCFRYSGKGKYLNAVARIDRRKKELQKLEQQTAE